MDADETTSEQEAFPYPDEITQATGGQDEACAAMAVWVSLAFDEAAKLQKPLFGWGEQSQPWRPQFEYDSDEWREADSFRALHYWVYWASRDPGIEKYAGRSDVLFDQASFRLRLEALDFVNDLLRRYEKFDGNTMLGECLAFWDELSAGDQQYEVGGIVFKLDEVVAGVPAPVPVGPKIELRSITGSWGDERFSEREKYPRGAIAVSAVLTEPRDPLRHIFKPKVGWLDSYAFRKREERDAKEEAIFELALLALRLVAPGWYFVGSRFRVNHRGYRLPPEKASYREPLGSSKSWTVDWLSRSLVRKLKDVGGLLALRQVDLANADDLLSLALRSFNGSYERRNWRDQTVDLAIALEALFAQESELITLKAATRAALLLGTTPEHSELIQHSCEKFYGFRSKIVAKPTEVERAATTTIQAWKTIPMPDEKHRRPAVATGIGRQLVSQALVAFLRLEGSGKGPFGTDFLRQEIDPLQFDPAARNNVRRLAGVLPRSRK